MSTVCSNCLRPRWSARLRPRRWCAMKQTLSYGELNRRANQLAHHLRRLGVGPETVVGILLERSVEMMCSVLAVLKAGGAYLPLELTLSGGAARFYDAGCGCQSAHQPTPFCGRVAGCLKRR